MHPDNDSQSEPNATRENGGSGAARGVRRRRWPFVVGGLVALGLLVLTVGLVAVVLTIGLGGVGGSAASTVVYEEEYVSGDGVDKIAVIPIEGRIASADSAVPSTQPPVTPEGLADALRQAAEDGSVAAVVLEVNSPGGGVTASDVMHQSILDFKERTGKPVVVSMGDVAASGGYYISTAADWIVANETTLTGSLGVFIPLLNLSEAADKYGVTQEYIKSGRFKAIGNPWDKLTSEEREIFQSIVQDDYNEFVEVIVEGRELSEERVREIADGRIYSGERARELGLVDSFGGLDEAATKAAELANASETTVVRYVQSPSFMDAILSGLFHQPSQAERVINEAGITLEPKPYYLYLPGA